jgi:tRNA threonylcarbamoyladenosine biosynthesis protein TsaB
MTKLLAIETSAEACSVALHCDGDIRVFFEHAPMRHAELLLPAVQKLLGEAGISLGQLDAIAFGRGPGSFTSLRIGIGVVQGLAWGADIPVVPVSSLAAAAQDAAESSNGSVPSICIALDARMGEVYTAQFSIGSNGIVDVDGEERVCAPGLVTAPGSRRFVAAGNGFGRFGELHRLASAAVECYPDIAPRAETVCKLAQDWLTRNQPLAAAMAQPVYVRNKVADKPSPV